MLMTNLISVKDVEKHFSSEVYLNNILGHTRMNGLMLAM